MTEISKVMALSEAIARYVRNGQTIALEGFTHLIPFAAGHEIIRQRFTDLTLVRMTPDIIADQMVAAGCVSKLVFGYVGNSAVGSLYAIRRAVEGTSGRTLDVEEYSHHGLLGRYIAGASNIPFYPLRSYAGGDLAGVNPQIRTVVSPYGETDSAGKAADAVYVVPRINPDVAIIHAQRADADGNVQAWGVLGPLQEAAFAARRTIAIVEEIAPSATVSSDPNRTVVPGLAVDAVVECSFGCHPSYVQGYYVRDNDFYRSWSDISRDESRLQEWLQEWVYGVAHHRDYLSKIGDGHLATLRARPALAAPVSYGGNP